MTKYYTILFLLIFLQNSAQLKAEEEKIKFDTIPRNYIFYPKSYEPGEFGFHMGLGITRLPEQVVEEEISFLPMPNIDFRIGISKKWSLLLDINANYISNYANIGLIRSHSLGNTAFSIGSNFSAWFGHLEIESFKMKTWGLIFSPNISLGFDFGSLFFSAQFETQHHLLWNYSDEEILGVLKKFDGGFAVRFTAEQPLWNNHWVALTLKLNYSKFYYQSWISYSTVDEYFFYPEFIFGFIL